MIAMIKKILKPRPKQGEHLTELRKSAGLSQYDLARLLNVPQPNIAFWELHGKTPNSNILSKMANALGVSVDELLNGKALTKKKSGPIGKAHRIFEEVSQLPRHQQQKIIEVVEALVAQHNNGRLQIAQ